MKKLLFALFACSFTLHGSVALAKCSDYSNCAEVINGWKAGDLKLERDNNNIPCQSLCGENGENMFKKVGSAPNSQSVGSAWSKISTWYAEAPVKLGIAIGTLVAEAQLWLDEAPAKFGDALGKFTIDVEVWWSKFKGF